MAPTSAAPSDLTGDTERILAGAPQTMGIPLAILAWYGPVCHALRNVLSTPPLQRRICSGEFWLMLHASGRSWRPTQQTGS